MQVDRREEAEDVVRVGRLLGAWRDDLRDAADGRLLADAAREAADVEAGAGWQQRIADAAAREQRADAVEVRLLRVEEAEFNVERGLLFGRIEAERLRLFFHVVVVAIIVIVVVADIVWVVLVRVAFWVV